MATTTTAPAAPAAAPALPRYKGAELGRSTVEASRSAFAGLLLRDLAVLKKNLKEFLPRTILQPFLLVFVFLYVFPTIGQGIGGGRGAAGAVVVAAAERVRVLRGMEEVQEALPEVALGEELVEGDARRDRLVGQPGEGLVVRDQSLAEGRLWHFACAWLFVINGFVYFLHALLSRHFWRDLVPSRRELGRIGNTAWDHLRLRFPAGEEAIRYNLLPQISHLAVLFVLLPVMVIAGLAMSPRMDAGFPELLGIFGGRQSARRRDSLPACWSGSGRSPYRIACPRGGGDPGRSPRGPSRADRGVHRRRGDRATLGQR